MFLKMRQVKRGGGKKRVARIPKSINLLFVRMKGKKREKKKEKKIRGSERPLEKRFILCFSYCDVTEVNFSVKIYGKTSPFRYLLRSVKNSSLIKMPHFFFVFFFGDAGIFPFFPSPPPLLMNQA